MTLVFLLSLHFLLMFGYMILIETGKSRLGYGHWLFALFLPFAGVLCLLTADFGRSPAANDYVRPFKQFDCAKLSEEGPEEAILPGTQITRQQLLDTIQRRPANLAAILTEALTSEDVEVVHIASSTIMKLQSSEKTDSEGNPIMVWVNLFSGKVWCKWVYAHGDEIYEGMCLQVGQLATVTMRYTPKVDVRCRIWHENDPQDEAHAWEVVSINDPEDRHKFLDIELKRVVVA